MSASARDCREDAWASGLLRGRRVFSRLRASKTGDQHALPRGAGEPGHAVWRGGGRGARDRVTKVREEGARGVSGVRRGHRARHGFARLKCGSCDETRLLAFSCKGRGFCPSCLGRKMTATAAHLIPFGDFQGSSRTCCHPWICGSGSGGRRRLSDRRSGREGVVGRGGRGLRLLGRSLRRLGFAEPPRRIRCGGPPPLARCERLVNRRVRFGEHRACERGSRLRDGSSVAVPRSSASLCGWLPPRPCPRA